MEILNWRTRRKIKRWATHPSVELYFLWYKINRWFAINVLGWRDAEKDYPILGDVCRIYGMKNLWEYKDPGDYPDFCHSEEDKRMWFRFEDDSGCILNAINCLWKQKRK